MTKILQDKVNNQVNQEIQVITDTEILVVEAFKLLITQVVAAVVPAVQEEMLQVIHKVMVAKEELQHIQVHL